MAPQLKATVGPSPEDNNEGHAELSVGTHIVDTKQIDLETVNGGRTTLKRNVLNVIGIEPQEDGHIKIVAQNASGKDVHLLTDTDGRLREYSKIIVKEAA